MHHLSAPSAITDGDDSKTLYSSILKDVAEEYIPKTLGNTKPCFSPDICKDGIKERNKALDKFKREPIEGNLNV